MTEANSSELEVEWEIQAATNAFGALLPKLEMYNAPVPRSYSMKLDACQEADKSTMTLCTKFSA